MTGINAKEVFGVSQLVSTQPGGIVSRQIIHQASGNLTLFAFDEGQQLSEHMAPYDALVHVLEGQAEIIIDGEAFTVQTGEMILMPANHPHAVRATTPFKMLLSMYK